MSRLILYSSADCELCEQAEALLNTVFDENIPEIEAIGYQLEKIDIDSARELQQRFGLSIPVLAIPGPAAPEFSATCDSRCEKLLYWPFPLSRLRQFLVDGSAE